ncbi:hypothetical protein EDB85DRAFT_2153854 [Lactarius pseudohatsudake]|nr:hypothetical protein EDB85DRAFT_2153854 [Lactarius pseudohatsudake]
MYAKTLSNHSALYKRLQPAQRRARVPQCNCDNRAICRGSPSHVAMTASEPHSRRLPRRVHTLAMTFHATESVYQFRGDMRGGSGARTAQAYQEQPHQVASSADPTASAPQLRGGSHVAIEFERTLRIDRSVYRSRGSVRDRTRRGSSKNNSQREEDTNAESSGSAMRARTPAAYSEIGNDCQHPRQHSRHPQLRARYAQISTRQEWPTSSSFKRRLDRERATVARQSRSSVRDRTRHVSSKTDSQRDKELKRKTSATTTAAPCARGHARGYPQQRARYSRIDLLNSRAASIKRFTRTRAVATAPFARGLARRVYSWATKDSTRSNVHSNCGNSIAQNTPSASAPVTAPAPRAPSHLAQGFSTILCASSSDFQSREGTRDKCDVTLGEERRARQSQVHKTYRPRHARTDSHAFPTRATTLPSVRTRPSRTARSKHSRIALNSARARLALHMTRTPAAGMRTTSKQPQCTQMTEDSQDLSEEEMIRLRSPCLVKSCFLQFLAVPYASALARAFPRSPALCLCSLAPSRALLRSCALSKRCVPTQFAAFLRTCALCRALARFAAHLRALLRSLSTRPPTFPCLYNAPHYLAYSPYSPLVFLSVPHSRAALATHARRVPDPGGHSYEVSRRADACATICDHLRSTDLAPLPNLAALARGTIPSTATRSRPPRTYIRHLAPREGLRDRLRRFTPQNPAQP